MAVAYGNTGGADVQESTTQDTTGNLQQINLELQRLIESRKNKGRIENPLIREIVDSTVRTVKGLVAGKSEFFYVGSFKPVKDGTSYHIHYTKDLGEYYMTDGTHTANSKLISPYDFKNTDFGYYNSLNRQSPLTIEGRTPTPNDDDYARGHYTRYFARKVSGVSTIFEILKNQVNSSPLYEYISLEWYIVGSKIYVYTYNTKQILIANSRFFGISNILPPYQFFKNSVNLTAAELVKERLKGTPSVPDAAPQSQAPTVGTTNTNVQTSVPSGVPTDIYSGGASSGGGY